jgi:hypothetical protein
VVLPSTPTFTAGVSFQKRAMWYKMIGSVATGDLLDLRLSLRVSGYILLVTGSTFVKGYARQ